MPDAETIALQERLGAVEDRLAIIELEGAYARSFDERDGATWSSLFTTDGIYQSRPVGDSPPITFVQGTDALHAFCRDAPFDGIHFLHLPQITLAGDTATARIHLQFHGVYGAADDGADRRLDGFYDVAYRRVDGRWLIAHRVTSAFSREVRTAVGYPTAPALPTR